MYVNFDLETVLVLFALLGVAFYAGRLVERSENTTRETSRLRKEVRRLSTQQGKRIGLIECAMAQLEFAMKQLAVRQTHVERAKVIDGDDPVSLIQAKGQAVRQVERAKGMMRVLRVVAVAAVAALLTSAGVTVPPHWLV